VLPDPAAGLADLLTTLAGERAGDAMSQVWLGAYQARIGALDEARRHFEQAIQQAPDDWLAYALLAATYVNAGQSQQAQTIVAQGLEAIPDSPALAALQVRLQGEDANTPDGLKEALDRGRQALREQDWTAAIAAGQQAVALAPDRSDSHLLLGDAYRASGELGQALASYRRATELTPQLSLYHARQSEILVRLGQPADALDRALLALALEDSRWENWLALGRTLATLGEEDTGYLTWAGHALEQAVALAPENNQAPARALAEFQAAQQTQPASAASPASAAPPPQTAAQQRAQAEALLQAGQVDQALAQYQALVDADPQDRASRMGVAAALKALGRVDEAIAAYEQISSEWPDFPFANVRRGELLERRDNLAGAIDAYRAAVQAAPDNADLRFTLAFALRRAGQRDDAMAELQAGLKLDPARQAAQEALQELQSGKP
jgi:tetratricopeptide (TPR) repeat protein